jgi:hypothetical protein
MKKNLGGRPRLPRDKNGKIIREIKGVSTITKTGIVPVDPKPAPAIEPKVEKDPFLAAANESILKIEKETAEAIEAQKPSAPEPVKVEKTVEKAPAQVDELKIGSFDYTDIISPVIRGGGLYLADQTKCEEMAFNDEETAKLAKASSDLLNILFPDLEALTEKEKIIVASVSVFINVGQTKLVTYQRHKKKLKNPQPAA